MSPVTPFEAPASGEPAVRDPRLQLLVDAARSEPAPVVRVDAEAVYAGWQERRTSRRRGVTLAIAVAAAVLLAVGLAQLREGVSEPEAPVAVQGGTRAPEAPRAGDEPGADEPAVAVPNEPERPAAPVLASTIHVAPLEPGAAGPEVLGPRRLRLPEGRWSVDSEEAEPVEVVLPDGALELRGGSVHVQVAGDVAHVDVLREAVLRIDASGRRVTLRPRPPEAPAETPTEATAAGPGPAELARQAEALLAAGDRAGAIRALRRLVTRHGRSAAAQTGLIDLGRLLKAAGQADEARCAYGMFLARWPGHALAGDVARSRDALGEGPTCDGLRPR